MTGSALSRPPDLLDGLRRAPDVEAPGLLAVDAADRLVLDEAADRLAAAGAGEVVVLGDRYGALTIGAVALHGAREVRVHTDRLLSERALARNAEATGVVYAAHPLSPALLSGARLVLLALPRGLDALDDLAGAVARWADPGVAVVAGGRLKHMSLGMNAVLARHFADVRASRARQKARVLHAGGPAAGPDPGPAAATEDGLHLRAYGGVFAGASVDRGTRLLLRHLETAAARAEVVVDLGCGTGVLACRVKQMRPAVRVVAVDESAAAARSAVATAAANGLDVEVVRDTGLPAQADGSVDLVLLNPPFHTGATVTSRAAHPLFAEAARLLRPGGELWTVYNSPLGHREVIQRLVGPTRQVDRDRTFTVTASVRRAPAGTH